MSTDGEASDNGWSLCPAESRNEVALPQNVFFLSRFGPTQLIQFGFKDPVTDISRNPFHGVKRVLFFIPGNPGAIAMYRYFLEQLHQSLGIPVIGLSHVGHIREGIHRFKSPITVRKLVEHKIEFIENVIPADVEIILCGHSVGTFMSVQVMRLIEKRERFVHNIMLMPCLERFTSTPGWKSLRFSLNFRHLFFVIVAILSLMKDEILLRIVPHLIPELKSNRTPDCVYEGILQLVHWKVCANILELAQDESQQIQERDDIFLHKNIHKCSLFYTLDDHWVPLTFFRNLKRRFPSSFTDMMDTVTHSFVMDRKMTEEVVSRVSKRYHSDLINKDMD